MKTKQTLRRKIFQFISLTIMSGSIAACGGGGGGGDDTNPDQGGDPPPPPPTNNIMRPVVIEYDNDNNGTTDAMSTLTYDANGRVTRDEYVNNGDGTADAFDLFDGEAQVLNEFSYYANGGLQSHKRTDSNGSVEFVYSYDAAGNVSRIDVTQVSNIGTTNTYYEYTYNNNQAQRFDIRLTSNDMLLVTENYDYDMQDRVVQDLGTFAAGGVGYERRYTWDAQNRLDFFEFDGNGDGVFEITYDYIFNDTTGKLEQRINTNSVVPMPSNNDNFTEFLSYDADGLLDMIEYDNSNDGSLDATARVTQRESGPCTAVYLPVLSTQAGQDGVPGSNNGDITWCE